MLSRRPGAEKKSTSGFVLIEVLVAVAVAAILMAVLLRSFTTTWYGINSVREQAEAMLLARNLLVESDLRGGLVAGVRSGKLRRYSWTMTVSKAPVVAHPTQKSRGRQKGKTLPWTLYRVDLSMGTPSGGSISLETYRIGKAAE